MKSHSTDSAAQNCAGSDSASSDRSSTSAPIDPAEVGRIAEGLSAAGLRSWLHHIVDCDADPLGADPETTTGRRACGQLRALGLASENEHGEFRSTPLGRAVAAALAARGGGK